MSADSKERRSRSPRPRIGRDTNSNDQRSLRCRVFVGNLAVDKASKLEIEEIFGKYGTIDSVSIHKNFGFVQFTDEKGADAAVLEMHGKTIFGKRIDVNLAGMRRKAQEKDKFEAPPPKEEVVPENMRHIGKRSPRRRSRSPVHSGSNYGRSLSPMSRYEELYRKDDPFGRYGAYDPQRDFPPGRRYAPHTHDDGYPPSYGGREFPPRSNPYGRTYDDHRPPPQRFRPSTDCEIISLSKEESRYAEEVEARLRSIGLVCNIGYPPIDLPVAEVIDRITRAGTLYVIVVSAQNAIHRSCTLNILHGARQEHRNMPLDDAISFVARNFDTYLKVLREPFRGPPPGAYDPVYDRAYPPPPSHNPPVGGVPPAREKAMSTDELNAMIEKLKREKEQREAGLRKNDENGAPPQGGQSEQLSNNTSASNINYPPYSQGNSSRGEHDGTRAPQYYNQQQHSYR